MRQLSSESTEILRLPLRLAELGRVLYVIMMYISVYPIALSVRATNVYEERSLGLYNEESDDVEMNEKGVSAVAKYVGWQ